MSNLSTSARPTINGVVEAALYAEDLARSAAWYQDLFGFERELSNEFICVFRIVPHQVFILFPRSIAQQLPPTSPPPIAFSGTIPGHGGNGRMHVAFAISPSDLASWEERLDAKGIPVESKVHWKRGGYSLYFRDPDQNLLELITPGLWSSY